MNWRQGGNPQDAAEFQDQSLAWPLAPPDFHHPDLKLKRKKASKIKEEEGVWKRESWMNVD